MAELRQIYKCQKCGNMTEVVHASSGLMTCCEQPMKEMFEGTVDAAKEKHIPVIEKVEGGFKVIVGEVQHPMQDDHYIEFIEAIADGKVYRQHLNPGDKPEAVFKVESDKITAREYCNLHGLWKA